MSENISLFVKMCLVIFLGFYSFSGFQMTHSGLQLFALVSVATSIMIYAFISVLKTEGKEK